MTFLSACKWPEHWPAHNTRRGACHEGDCFRCGMEQEHEESHEGEPCPWLTGLDEFTSDPEPLTFEEITWGCPNCGWTSALCTEHRAQAEEIRAEQDEDARREAGEDW